MSEIDKMTAVKAESNAIGEFVDWLAEEKSATIAVWTDRRSCEDRSCHREHPHLDPIYTPIEKLLAEHFEIDLNKVEDEKRALLDQLRAMNS